MSCVSEAGLPRANGIPGWRSESSGLSMALGRRRGVLLGQASGPVPVEPGTDCPRGLAGGQGLIFPFKQSQASLLIFWKHLTFCRAPQ